MASNISPEPPRGSAVTGGAASASSFICDLRGVPPASRIELWPQTVKNGRHLNHGPTPEKRFFSRWVGSECGVRARDSIDDRKRRFHETSARTLPHEQLVRRDAPLVHGSHEIGEVVRRLTGAAQRHARGILRAEIGTAIQVRVKEHLHRSLLFASGFY